MSVLLVEAGGAPYAIPLDRVERTVRLADHTVRSVAGPRMLVMRDGVLPLLDAHERARARRPAGRRARRSPSSCAAASSAWRSRVERLVGQQELVTRPLPEDVADRAALSGGAVLSNGDIALIVDCDADSPSRLPCARGASQLMTHYTDLQLDALRELANIGSGNAGTALSSLLGRPVDISVPDALALPLAEAVEAAGDARAAGHRASCCPSSATSTASCCCSSARTTSRRCAALLGVEPGTEVGDSALGEIGNILGTSYINSLAAMTGIEIEPGPPQVAADMLGALVATVVMSQLDGASDTTLMLDSALDVEGEACSMSFLLVPAAGGVRTLLERLGLGARDRTEVMVRMGELAASADGRRRARVARAWGRASAWRWSTGGARVAGLAHVMLPEAPAGAGADAVARFADTAVPELLEPRARPRRAARRASRSSIVGGAADVRLRRRRSTPSAARNEAGRPRGARAGCACPSGPPAPAASTGRTHPRRRREPGEVRVKEAGGEPMRIGPECHGETIA